MKKTRYHVVLIEDNKTHAEYIESILGTEQFDVQLFTDGKKGYNYLLAPEVYPDVVIVDNYLPGMTGLELIQYFIKNHFDYGFIILTGSSSIDLAVQALKVGALDYVTKSIDIKSELPVVVEKTIARNQERIANRLLQEELVKSEERFKNYYNNVPVPTYTWKNIGGDFELVEYNIAASEQTQGKIDELLHIKASEVYREGPDVLEIMQRCYQEQINIYEERLYRLRTTGEEKYLKITYVYVGPDSVMIHTEDIGAQKKYEQELKERSRQRQAIFETIPAAINVVNKDFKVIECNRNMLSFFGVENKEDVIGQSCMVKDANGIEISRYSDIPLAEALKESGTRVSEKGEIAGGVYKIFHSPIHRDDEVGGVDGFVEVIVDITEEKRKEEELKQLNATKDKLFSIIGHDLRDPIGGFKMLINSLLSGIEDYDAAYIERALRALDKTASATYNLLENLLYWAKAQLGSVSFEPDYVPLHRLVESTVELYAELLKNKQLEFLNQVPENLTVWADKNMLKAIMRNLVTNAIKFSPQGKTLRVIASGVDGNNVISVVDEGVGIKPEDVSKLFDPNQNFTTFGTQRERGSGLGLLICKDFVERHSGRIWVESELNKGSKFIFSLPMT